MTLVVSLVRRATSSATYLDILDPRLLEDAGLVGRVFSKSIVGAMLDTLGRAAIDVIGFRTRHSSESR